VKLLRTIRLDPSDTFIFERVAVPGEWAVPGTFAFAPMDVARLEGKPRAAFRSGFLGIESLGWSTLVEVAEASEEERVAAVERLAQHLVERFGAPDLAVARGAAEEELGFAASLSKHPEGTLIAVARKHENGDICESFRTLAPGVTINPRRAFAFADTAEAETVPAEEIDLLALAKEKRP
jgi:hypothetical protein